MTEINLILPKNFYLIPDLYEKKQHVYFLAGPIRGAEDWQKDAIKILSEKDPGCYIACPRRYTEDHELFQYSLPDNSNEYSFAEGDMNQVELKPFENQTTWERYYLNLASFYGSIIFYLPCEDQQNPRPKEDGPYAQDTYGELGRWIIKSAKKLSLHDEGKGTARVHLVVGADKNFFGLRTIQRNFNGDHYTEYPIYSSLEETIDAAITLAQKPVRYYRDAFFDDDNK
jgi:hypothetical protein